MARTVSPVYLTGIRKRVVPMITVTETNEQNHFNDEKKRKDYETALGPTPGQEMTATEKG